MLYRYNAAGQRIYKNVNGTVEHYVMNGSEPIAVLNADGTLRYWITSFGRAEKSGSSYVAYYYLKDHLGSTRVVMKEDGTRVEGYDFEPWGGIMPGRSYASGSNTKEKFTGKERDAETQLDYFGARYYHPGIGRWLSVDPLAEKYPAWSPYNYTLNNPVNNTDSSGMCPDDDPNCFDSQVVIERKGYSQFRRFLFKAQAFVHGVGNAILDNATPFNFRSPIGHTLYENEPEAYNLGQDVGDSISAVVGTAETVVGVVEAGAGATTTVGSGGTTALVSVPATAQGVALAGHGLSTTLKAIENLIGQNGRVYATYDPSPKHHPNARKGVSDAPTDGQKALDGSVPTGDNSARRVGVNKETGEFNIFNETHRGKEIFHGHQRTWKELDQKQKRALINAGLVNKKGKIQ